MRTDYSILIPTWNNLDLLKNCISSIRKHSVRPRQILVFVNEGRDGTEEWLIEEGIQFIASPINVGICTAMNRLRELARSPFICYLNDDMYVLPHWDMHVLNEIKELGGKDFFISSTMIEPNSEGNPCSINGDYGDSLENFKEADLVDKFKDHKFQDWSGSSWPPLWISTKMWDRIGGFSEEFSPGMYSDPDMAMKAWDVGCRIYKGISESRVYHFGSKTTIRKGMNAGRKTFIKKWGITSRYFYKYYLRMGGRYGGPLQDVKHPIFGKIINRVKTFIN